MAPRAKKRPTVEGVDLLVAGLGALNHMTDHEREAFVDHVVLGWGHDRIARSHGVSRQRVGQLLRQARRKLAPHLGVRLAA